MKWIRDYQRSSLSEIIEEISVLEEMENQLKIYIEDVRKEQSNFRNFVQEIMHSAWQQGIAKEAFLKRISIYNEEFTKQIQKLENSLLDIIETRKWVFRLYQSMIPDFK